MRTAISGLELYEPPSLTDALAHMRDTPDVTPIAGGTDLYVALNFGTLATRRFVNLWALDELREIRFDGDSLRIGALASYAAICRSPLVRDRLPMLVAAALEIGGLQIQNRGTLGGNIANASPAGDSLPVLLAADAIVVLASAEGQRTVPMAAFYTGYRRSVMRPAELIVAVTVRPVEGHQWFRKVGTRAAQAISKIVMAGVRASTPRLAIGSVAPVPLRLTRTEQALASGASLDDARRVLESEISPIDDLRSTADYRRRVAGNLLARFWRETEAA